MHLVVPAHSRSALIIRGTENVCVCVCTCVCARGVDNKERDWQQPCDPSHARTVYDILQKVDYLESIAEKAQKLGVGNHRYAWSAWI